MPGILCFRNMLAESVFSPSISDVSVLGSPDASHLSALAIDGRADTYYRRTGASQVILRTLNGLSTNAGVCVAGAIGVQAFSGGGIQLPIHAGLKVGTGAGLSDVYSGSRRIVAGNSQNSIINPVNAFFVIDPMTAQDRIDGGGVFVGTGSVHVEWTFTTTASAEWLVREVSLWTGLAAKVKPNRTFGGWDPSDMQRAYGGAEQVSPKNTKREHAYTLTDMDDRQVYGGARGAIPAGFNLSNVVSANVGAVNLQAGVHKPVVMVPHSGIGTSGYADASDTVGRNWDVDYRAQSEIVWGYLSKPLFAKEIARVKGGSFWETDFTIIDAFNGVG